MLVSFCQLIMCCAFICLSSVPPYSFASIHHSGATLGAFSVDGGGSGNYSVDIQVPPGIAGMQPSLSLNYNSNGGNGYLGVGWSLGGISAITRCPQTLAQDALNGGINFDQNDRFCLDGQRLVAINGTYGAVGAEYRMEKDNFSKIISVGAQGNGPKYFEVHTKSGQKIIYGMGASGIKAQGRQEVFVWNIYRVYDSVNNVMEYRYTEDSTTGEYYLSNILYGAYLSQQVQFSYEERNDASSGYVSGSKSSLTKRLQIIKTTSQGLPVKEYRLGYEYGGATKRSRLVTLSECGSDNKCKLSSNFDWTENQPGFEIPSMVLCNTCSSGGNTYNATYQFTADFNGDGKTDYMWLGSGNNWYVVLGQSDGTFGAVSKWFNGSEINTDGVSVKTFNATYQYVSDFNGDGNTDYLWNDNGWYVALSNGSGFDAPKRWMAENPIPYNGLKDVYGPEIADYNGDGRSDFMFLYVNNSEGKPYGWYVWLSNGDSFNSPQYWQDYYHPEQSSTYSWVKRVTYNSKLQYIADFNGDSLIDRMFYSWYGWEVSLSNGNGFDDPVIWMPLGVAGTSNLTNENNNTLGDFNGDGKADYMWLGSDNNWYVSLSKGIGFETPKIWLNGYIDNGAVRTYNHQYQYARDFNGDGKADWLFNWNGWRVALSNGDGFDAPVLWMNQNPKSGVAATNAAYQHFGDFNGDGKLDYLWNYNGWQLALNKAKFNSTNIIADQLFQVTDGLGDQITIEYEPLTNNNIYSKGAAATYPVIDVQVPMYVVSKYSIANGLGIPYSFNYKYEGLRAHSLGFGMLGFEKVTVTDDRHGLQNVSYYSQDYDKQTHGMAWKTEIRLANGNLLESNTTSWSTTPFPSVYDKNKRYIIHKTSEVEISNKLRNQSQVSIVTTNYQYKNEGTVNDYGNVEKIIVTTNDGYVKTTENNYADNIYAWHLGRLTYAKVTHETPFETRYRESAFTYDASTGLLKTEVVEPNRPEFKKTTTYGYDAYGNKTSVAVSANGVATRTTTTQYDANGQFPSQTTNALGHTETYIYDPKWGVKTRLVGPNGLPTKWEYDSLGRQIKETRANGNTTIISYNLCELGAACQYGSPLWITKQSTGSAPRTIYFDPLGREVRTETLGFDGRKIVKKTSYDLDGRAKTISQLHFDGNSTGYTSYTYDKLGRVTVEKNPDNSVSRKLYDGLIQYYVNDQCQVKQEIKNSQGKIVEVGNGKLTSCGLNIADDQLLSSVQSMQVLASSYYVYDAFGNLISTINNIGNATSMAYDIAGFKTSMDDLDMGHWEYDYNALGELIWQKDAKGQITTMTYDKLGRMVSRIDAEGTSTWVYDTAANGKGKLHKSYSASNVTQTNTYDNFGRPSKTSTNLDGKIFDLTITYDTYGRVSTKTYPSGAVVSNEYNSYGFLSKVKNPLNNTTYWQATDVDARGKVTAETLGNGVQTARLYNANTGRIEGILTGTAGMGGNVQSLSYQFDTLGNMIARTDDHDPQNVLHESFEFDAFNRMTSSKIGADEKTYTYDSIGNITSKSGVGAYTYGENGAGVHAVTTAGGVSYQYDANGNMLSGDGRTITYTAFNKPLTINRGSTVNNTYTYGIGHDRIKKTSFKNGSTTTTYYVGKAYEKVYKPSGVQEHKHYISAGGATIVYTRRSNNTEATQYIHKDHLGSTDVITDASGNIVSGSRSSFDAWGARRNTNWTDTGNFGLNLTSLVTRGFTGHEMDDEVGLINMNARMYDAKLGRFLSPDTYVQFPYSTQGMNRYTYVNNNPISFTDPTGHFLKKLFKKVKRFVKKYGRAIVAIVAAYYTWQWAWATIGKAAAANALTSTTFAAYSNLFALAATGATAGFVGGAIISNSLEGGLVGAFQGGLFGFIGGLGLSNPQAVLAHGAVGGASSELSGGSFKSGFLSAAFAKVVTIATRGGASGYSTKKLVIASVSGGIGSRLGGGKFNNGVVTAAFGYLFNEVGGSGVNENINERKLCGAGTVVCIANGTGGIGKYEDGDKLARYTCENSGGVCQFIAPSNGTHVFGAAGWKDSFYNGKIGTSATRVESFVVKPDSLWHKYYKYNSRFIEELRKVQGN